MNLVTNDEVIAAVTAAVTARDYNFILASYANDGTLKKSQETARSNAEKAK